MSVYLFVKNYIRWTTICRVEMMHMHIYVVDNMYLLRGGLIISIMHMHLRKTTKSIKLKTLTDPSEIDLSFSLVTCLVLLQIIIS
jgi:hypothetical protein